MAVRIDEARQQGLAREINHHGGRTLMKLLEIRPGADHQDFAVLHGEGLSGGLGVVDGDDVAAVVNSVGGIGGVGAGFTSSSEGEQYKGNGYREQLAHG